MEGLLFITHKTDRYGYFEGALAALDGGCRRIQLRMKDEPVNEVLMTARQLKAQCEKRGADLYIDDYVGVAMQLMAKGVHLGKNDARPSEARSVMWKGSVIGGTANTFEDIVDLEAQGVDYIGLGPFRFTETKKNLSPVLGVGGYAGIMERMREAGLYLPVVAIGGITADDIPEIMAAGVSAIAMSSNILSAEDPVAETKRIIEIINNCRK